MSSIADVAKEANVSVATVSRVINNSGAVTVETTKRVQKAIDKLSYEPNLAARNLRKEESGIILILTPNLSNPYYTTIISGIGDSANDEGYSAFLCNTGGDRGREEAFLKMLDRKRADGAVLLASEPGSGWLKRYAGQFSIVQCSEFDPNIAIPHVCVDNYAASVEATNYLISLGHTKIATISSTNNYISTCQRLKGYRDALSEAGLPLKDDYIYRAARDYAFKSGLNAAKSLLSLKDRPTALFCVSDTLALGSIIGAQEMGYSVPDDVSVIGFDDVENTTMMHPYITSIAQPCYDIGKYGAQMLFRNMRGDNGSSLEKQIILPHNLTIRESTARHI